MGRKLTFLLVALPVIAFRVAAQKSDIPPLFQDEKPLTIRLQYALNKIKNSTHDTIYFSSILAYKNEQDGWDSLAIRLRARGNYRRQHCFFPPLRLKIKKNDATETPFAGNKSLKLVVPCQNAFNSHDLIMKEYLCYQLYKAVTPYSFNTRLADIALGNVTGKKIKTYPVLGFFIEDDDLLARRLKGKVIDSINVRPYQLHDTSAIRHDFFEYLIANTDWSATFFHNIKIIETTPRKYIPVPYDFDMAGLVNAPYAVANETLNLSSVRERLYRGFCRNDGLTEFVRAEYIQLELRIFEVINRFEGSLDPKELAGIRKYTEEFFTIIKDDRKFMANIVQKCRRN
jgi:hypothetical protein